MNSHGDQAIDCFEPPSGGRDGHRFSLDDSEKETHNSVSVVVKFLKSTGYKGDSLSVRRSLGYRDEFIKTEQISEVLGRLGFLRNYDDVFNDQPECRRFPYFLIDGEKLLLVESIDRYFNYSVFDGRDHIAMQADQMLGKRMLYFIRDEEKEHLDAQHIDYVLETFSRFKPLFVYLLLMSVLTGFFALSVPLIIMVVYDQVLPSGSYMVLLGSVFGALILLSSEFLLRLIRGRILCQLATRFSSIMKSKVLSKVVRHRLIDLMNSELSTKSERVAEVDTISHFITHPTAQAILDIPIVVLFVILLTVLSPGLGLMACLGIAMMVVVAWSLRRIEGSLSLRVNRENKKLNDLSAELVDCFAELSNSGSIERWRSRYQIACLNHDRAVYAEGRRKALLNGVNSLVVSITGVGVLIIGAGEIMAGRMNFGVLIASMILIWRLLSPIKQIAMSYDFIGGVRRAIRSVNRLCNSPTEGMSSNHDYVKSELSHLILLQNIAFRYHPDHPLALQIPMLSLPAKSNIMVSGNSGSGKSTLLKVIAGHFHPQSGSVHIGGLDIRRYAMSDYRSSIAYLPEEPQILTASLRDNLLIASVNADDERLLQACEKIGLFDDGELLTEGLDTAMGGDRQYPASFSKKIGLIRLFLKEASLILLDEPSRNLDEYSVGYLIDYIQSKTSQVTMIMVSNHPAIRRSAQHDVLMENGRVQEIKRIDSNGFV
ncbi:ABC-type bacteriocin/lantibiotic exporter with double-glycine peptidase domain [Sinobacterium caligoides]|uniref:ABC-type bacteriocin/lantibiotic exporter with double-glycine peptidase domain n=1 Tax=Sinobacterium caligoides TaxID=933926 RepID=A0A3N2DQD4_9GAMM|nr:ATP-binding cassette domain-containing protein [Sinobacterium caligoides]ROS02036.1 ABC-type bacteriocin/lantibiotic exporter with double-glycine peptidase domain [Sinobacterium caligoides]